VDVIYAAPTYSWYMHKTLNAMLFDFLQIVNCHDTEKIFSSSVVTLNRLTKVERIISNLRYDSLNSSSEHFVAYIITPVSNASRIHPYAIGYIGDDKRILWRDRWEYDLLLVIRQISIWQEKMDLCDMIRETLHLFYRF